MRTQSPDTSPEIEERWIEAWRRMEPWEKLRIVTELMRATDEIAVAGIRERHPGATWRDVLGMLEVQSSRLDLACLPRWAAELGLADLLDRRDEARAS